MEEKWNFICRALVGLCIGIGTGLRTGLRIGLCICIGTGLCFVIGIGLSIGKGIGRVCSSGCAAARPGALFTPPQGEAPRNPVLPEGGGCACGIHLPDT